MRAQELIDFFNLQPHPEEGGFFAETYRCDESIPDSALPDRYEGPRVLATAIYFLLTPETCSAMHLLQSDEIFHFYLGDPVRMLHLAPGGEGTETILGPDIIEGMKPQVVVPRGYWQGARLIEGGAYALLGTTVAPGFEYRDYHHGQRSHLQEQYPHFKKQIGALTPEL